MPCRCCSFQPLRNAPRIRSLFVCSCGETMNITLLTIHQQMLLTEAHWTCPQPKVVRREVSAVHCEALV